MNDGDENEQQISLNITTSTFVRFWLVILGFLALAGIIYVARGPLVMFAVSFFLALVLNRPVSFLARHLPGRSRTLAITISYLIIAAIIAVFFITVIPVFTQQISGFLGDMPRTIETAQNDASWFNNFLDEHGLSSQFDAWIGDIQNSLSHTASNIGSSLVDWVSNIFGVLGNICLVAFATFFMLVEGPDWEQKFWRYAYRDPVKRRHHREVARKMYDVVSGYVTGQATVGVISGTFSAIVVGILALVFNFNMVLIWPTWITIFIVVFIPMFGAVIGGCIVTLLLMLYSVPAALIYIIVFTIEQQIENNIIQPRIQSKHVETSALIILIAMTLGLQVGGLLGALVAIPVAGCVTVLLRDFFNEQDKAATNERSHDHDNNIDGVLDSSEPVIFVPADRQYVGADPMSGSSLHVHVDTDPDNDTLDRGRLRINNDKK